MIERKLIVRGAMVGGGVVVLLLFALCVSGSDTEPPKQMTFVCVATGELFNLSIEEAGIIPAKNRDTGEYTLVPCVPAEGGGYRIAERYGGLFDGDGELSAMNRYVDPRTLWVLGEPREVKE